LLSHLFGHEGENSLLSSLVSVGLGESVSTHASTTMGQFTSLNISITLTEEGFAKYLEVISMVFAFAKILKEKANTEWLFNEYKGI
jgi:insulysin